MVQFDAGDYILLTCENDLLNYYSKPVYGKYNPQPYSEPERYPCLFIQVCIMHNPNGPDQAVLSYIYDFTEI